MSVRNPSAITELLQEDLPLLQNAGFDFDRNDRQYLDNQIRGGQRHLVDALIRGRHATYAKVAGSSAAGSAGTVVCLASVDEGEPKVTRAILAALTNAVAAFGVVVGPVLPGAFGLVAFGGVLPPSVTNLAPGAPGLVRVNTTTARCERVASFASGDYGIGVVDNAGYMLVIPGIGAGLKVLDAPTIGGPVTYSGTTFRYVGEPKSDQRDIQIASIQTTDATPTDLFTFATTAGRSYYLAGFIEGTTSSLSGRFLYRVEQYFDNVAGTVTARISSPTGGITELHESSGSMTLIADASGTNIRVRISVGLAATTVRWRGRLFLHEGLP